MFRFTIRDLLWLMTLAAIMTVVVADRWRQSAKLRALEELTHIESQAVFPGDWEGKVGAFRNQIVILRMQVNDLTRELQSRGHRVEIDDCGKVVVDRPQPLSAAKVGLNSNWDNKRIANSDDPNPPEWPEVES
jgi:hypothetical protein